jgi:ubiquinone/menaquinone biosynthesis C-methylase UbiE
MGPVMAPAARHLAAVLGSSARIGKVLDLAAGHGLFGIAVALAHPEARILAVDWPNVLEVARENAGKAGVEDRFAALPGSAFQVELGGGYDLALAANFFHHFDRETCIRLMVRLRAALAPAGRLVILEFVPDPGGVTPRGAAAFSLTMLVATPAGQAYTLEEYREMLRSAGFTRTDAHPVPRSYEQILISTS